MYQLFQNLLDNALKFHHPDRPLHITVEHCLVGPFCEITVADDGIGFEQADADRIFNVFERLENRDDYPGTGVGLAICRRIVERHGGDIHAQGKPGEGAFFTVRLLLSQPAEKH